MHYFSQSSIFCVHPSAAAGLRQDFVNDKNGEILLCVTLPVRSFAERPRGWVLYSRSTAASFTSVSRPGRSQWSPMIPPAAGPPPVRSARQRASVGKISAKCCSFSAVSAPIFARKYAFCSIFQNLPDSQAEIFEI